MRLALMLLALSVAAGAADETGVLEIRVFRGAAKLAAPGTVVTVAGGDPSRVELQRATNAVGRVRFEGLPIGVYELNAFLAGHLFVSVPGITTDAVIRAGETTSKDLILYKKPVVTGRVSDPDGRPLASVRVRLLKQTYARRGSAIEEAEYATTDDRGVYRFALEKPGRYWVLASRVEREYRYGGGAPVRYAFSPAAPDLAGAQPVDAAFDQPDARRDVVLPWAPAAGITVRVRSGKTGDDCRGCSFELLRIEGQARYPVHRGSVRAFDPPKTYGVRVPGLPAGRYRLAIQGRRAFQDPWGVSAEVAVGGSETAPFELTTRAPVIVSGRIEYVGEEKKPATSRPAQFRQPPARPPYLRLVPLPDGRRRTGLGSRGESVDDDQRFELGPVAARPHAFVARMSGAGYVSAIQRNGRALPNPVLDLDDGGDWSDLQVTVNRETAEFQAHVAAEFAAERSAAEADERRSFALLRVMLTPLEDDFTQPADGRCNPGNDCVIGNIAPGRYAVRVVFGIGDQDRLDRLRYDPSLAPWTREIELHPGPNPPITLSPVPDDVPAKL